MQTKFSGRPRQQGKPPVCKKAVQRPPGIPPLPNSLNFRLNITGEDSSGNPIVMQRVGAVYYDPTVATYYIGTWKQDGGVFTISVFPDLNLPTVSYIVHRAPDPIGGTWQTSGTIDKGPKKAPFEIGSFAIVADVGSGFGGLTINY